MVKLQDINDKLDILFRNKINVRQYNDECEIIDHTINCNKNTNVDTVFNSFCKYAIGVHKTASTTGVLHIMDMIPITIKMWTSSIVFWHKMETNPKTDLLYHAYQESKMFNHAFGQNVHYKLSCNGLEFIYHNPSSFSRRQIKSICTQNFSDQFKQMRHDRIHNDPKFNTIRLCDGVDLNEVYSKINSPAIQCHFTKLRLDEANKITNNDDKKCAKCASQYVSYTRHILIECSKISDKFNNLKSIISERNSSIILSVDQLIKFIINIETNDSIIINAICSYVKNIMQL